MIAEPKNEAAEELEELDENGRPKWGGTRDHKPGHGKPPGQGKPPGVEPQWGGTRSADEPDPAA